MARCKDWEDVEKIFSVINFEGESFSYRKFRRACLQHVNQLEGKSTILKLTNIDSFLKQNHPCKFHYSRSLPKDMPVENVKKAKSPLSLKNHDSSHDSHRNIHRVHLVFRNSHDQDFRMHRQIHLKTMIEHKTLYTEQGVQVDIQVYLLP